MKRILIFIGILKIICCEDMKPPEDINDLFPMYDATFSNGTNKLNTTFDIKKLDVKKLVNKINTLTGGMEVEPQNDTRRQVLSLGIIDRSWYISASDHMTRLKSIDMMLQTIYMARHIMKQLEADAYFNKKDTGYRIGFLYRKLRRIAKRLHDIYLTMTHNHSFIRKQLSDGLKENRYKSKIINFLVLHHKAVKLHTDFMYLWWVLIKVDGKYRDANNNPPKLARWVDPMIGGISEEKVKYDMRHCWCINLSPGQPVPQAEMLHEVLAANIVNFTNAPGGSLFDYLFSMKGTNTSGNAENLDINVLDVDNVKKIVDMAKRRYNADLMKISRRYPDNVLDAKQSQIEALALRQMQQSVYATRYRLEATAEIRNVFKSDVHYNIAILCGSLNQIMLKIENLYAQLLAFPIKTHFLWYLIVYEKILASNVDVNYIVKKMFELHHQMSKILTDK